MSDNRSSRYRSITGWVAVLVATVGGVLALNIYQAQQFVADAAAAQTIARAQVTANRVGSDLRALRLVLSEGGSIEPRMGEIRAATESLAADLTALAAGDAIGRGGAAVHAASLSHAKNREVLRTLSDNWAQYRTSLESLTDGASRGSTGEKLAYAIVGSGSYGQRLLTALDDLALAADRASGQRASQFRLLQIAGLALAVSIFLMILFQVLRNLRSEDHAIAGARRETEQILKTVGEGLFLLDREHRIGSELSDAMRSMFRRQNFENLTLESLLRDIVPEKTLRTALDFVELLWGDRVNEKLVKTLNPLNEVGAHFAIDGGEFESRFLAFDFNRVRVNGQMTQLLVTVNDITEKVLLARELQESQAQQQAQLDLLMSILHVEPQQLGEFLAKADGSMNLVNTVLKMPARDEASFREKLDKIFREVHSLKSDAAALGLPTVEQKAHVFEEALAELRGKSGLTGNDFLPLAVKLDDLFNHLASVKELVGRIGEMRTAFVRSAGGALDSATAVHRQLEAPEGDGGTVRLQGPTAAVLEAAAAHQKSSLGDALLKTFSGINPTSAAASIETHLRQLAEHVATNQGKKVSLVFMGLESVPAAYARPVRDAASQMVRNAIVHGIEAPSTRVAANKPEQGTIVVEFIERGADGFELVFQDDGAGVDVNRVRSVALEKGLISAAAADALDPRKLVGLIFRPGFSTAREVSTDAGRGVGLDVVHSIVTNLGGKIGVASKAGEYTRFRVKLPIAARTQAA
jgi:HPt (histidine-containing phosphotransfer) domain-containing protein